MKTLLMSDARDVLTPAALAMLQMIAAHGSFAAAARALNMVPSALTYRVRQIEQTLDVLLFDRRSRQARLTVAGETLLREGSSVLAELDAMVNRVKRVATGWEAEFTIAVDSIIDRATLMELCDAFFRLNPPTRLRLQAETLSGTLESLASGVADLALGVVMDDNTRTGLGRERLGRVDFVFAVAPHHPLARYPEPVPDHEIRQHRAVAIADSAPGGKSLTIGLLAGQDVFTVADMPSKLDAQLRGIGVGLLPAQLAQPYVESGRLVARQIERATQQLEVSYAWRRSRELQGKALQWWLARLGTEVTRAALLGERRKP